MRNWGTIRERFGQSYIPVTESGCWLWEKSTANCGYGKIRYGDNSKTTHAHRVSYELYKGDIPKGFSVLHRCDVPCCVNPEHLFIGTPQHNMDDMMIKGRGRNQYGVTRK
jgi:hypothetical protein